MGVEILTVGTEILLGQIVDTNAAYMAQRLAEAGIDLFFKATVGDNEDRLEAALREGLRRSDAVLCTGGLGPTEDDVTREVLARVLERPLRLNGGVLAHLEGRFAARGIPMAENNRKQAYVPEGAEVLPNPRGTAPGLYLTTPEGKVVAAMPGVPSEMRPMLTEQVIPRLRARLGIRGRIRSRVLRTCGASESRVDQMIGDLFRSQRNPSIGVLAQAGEIHVRLTAKGEREDEIDALLDDLERKLRDRIGPLIFGRDDEELEQVVGRLLAERGLTLAVAESCSGGLVAHRLTNVPGSSRYFERGVVAYSNRAKTEVVGVPAHLVAARGAVSPEVARAMAEGVRRLAGTDYGVGITGIAGPDGGTPEKPVGLTYIGLAWDGGSQATEHRFLSDRAVNKVRASQMALELLRRRLMGVDASGIEPLGIQRVGKGGVAS
jgi:nicotinamide-nucleotide amidase